jgi:replicative DNA helicase
MSTPKYEFDADFQLKVVAMSLRDEAFLSRVDGLVSPDYFEDEHHAYLVDLVRRHYTDFRQLPSAPIVLDELRKEKAAGRLKPVFLEGVKDVLKHVYGSPDLSNRDYTVQAVSKFAQKRAVEEGILRAAEMLDKGAPIEDIRPILSGAMDVGSIDGRPEVDYWNTFKERTDRRIAKLTSPIPTGITTGIPELDKELYHGGWGRRELSSLMGGPKAGKSIGLAHFAMNASLAGHNVLAVTLEVSDEITGDRLDANLSDTLMRELAESPGRVRAAGATHAAKAGVLKLREFPSGTFRPSDLRRLLRHYQSQSVIFDLIVIDYLDIMAPDQSGLEERHAMKSIYMGVRAIAQEEGPAILSATQTNRTGAKAGTATKTDVAEDFNKVRLVDIMLSINRDEDEKARNEMRLYFAAHRNGEEGFALACKTDYARMRFITKVLGRA